MNFYKVSFLALVVGISGCQSMNGSFFGKKKLSPEPLYQPKIIAGNLQTLLILPNRVSCDTIKPMQCMLVSIDDKVIKVPYDAIEGFTGKENTSYKISARQLIDENKQEFTGKWQLKDILTQKPVK